MKSSIDVSELKDFYEASSTSDKSGEGLSQKEFLVALIIIYILRDLPNMATPAARSEAIDKPKTTTDGGSVSPKPPPRNRRKHSVTGLFAGNTNDALKASFDLIVHAYLLFDPTPRGYIARTDVAKMMAEDGQKNSFLNEERWAEMDWNGDGNIDFSEFVHTFAKWVDIDED